MEREAYDHMDRSESSHWWFVARRKIIDTLIRREVMLPAKARILEAGCGTGGNLEMLSAHGEVAAFEYDTNARAIASAKSGVAVVPGALPGGLDQVGRDYDLVALLDVLEHIDMDEASLRSLGETLVEGGSIVVTVPAVPWLWSDHDVVHHHKRRYSASRLREVLSVAGFRDIRIGYFNSLLFPLALVERLLRAWGLKSGKPDDAVNPTVNGLFRRIFASEAVLLGRLRFPIGLSLYAVATR